MNILFICDEYPPGCTGGIGIVVQSLARELVAQGHNVYVAGLYEMEFGGNDYEIDNGVKVWRFRYKKNWPHSKLSYKIQKNLPHFLQTRMSVYKSNIIFLEFIKKIIGTEKIDIVEMADWLNTTYDTGINLPIPKLKVPLVVKFHGSMSYFNFEMNKPLRKKWFDIDKAIFDRADALSATSAYAANMNKKIFGTNKNIEILYNAIEMPAKTVDYIKRDHFTVVFAGTLIEKKGIFSLMKAWNIVVQKENRAKLLVFGKGDTEKLRQILNPEFNESVVFKGHKPKNTVLEAFAKASLAVFPSYSETFGLVAIEAMSVGCPTIFTTKASGTEIIRDGETGLLVDPNDIEQIAQTILLVLSDKPLQESLGKTGKKNVEAQFNIKKSAQDHVVYYQKTIDNFNNR
jgi:glycosyltransferase involved in cell wall biosynthesis